METLIKPYNRYYIPKSNKCSSKGDFFGRNKMTRKHQMTTGRNWSNVKRNASPRILAQGSMYQFVNVNHRLGGQTVEIGGVGWAERSQIETTKFIRQKEKKEYYTGSSNKKPRKRKQRGTYTQKNVYKRIQNETKRETKRTKLQI